jgi:hypothetical protein
LEKKAMKRDMELVRLILLKVEAEGTTPHLPMKHFGVDGREHAEVAYNVWLLNQAGFLEAKVWKGMNSFDCVPVCLTWHGAELLDSIRDPEVWTKTKAGMAKAGGAGLELMWDLAKAYAKAKLSETLGVAL